MAVVTLTRRYAFQAVHSLIEAGPYSERRHGHSYHLEVSFQDCSVAVADDEVKTRVLDELHGRDLAARITPATGETLVEWIHAALKKGALKPHLKAVALQETRKNRFVSGESEHAFV